MALPNKTFQQFVNDMQVQWANAVGIVSALQPGDVVLALIQALASQLVFIEALAQMANSVARAQTSAAADLDSFMAQFGFTRLPATFDTGAVTFGKLSAGASNVSIPAGAVVQTPGGAVQYQVVADTTQPTWSATLNAYVMVAGQTSLTATVQALVAGTSSNVAAAQLTQIAAAVPGIDTVTNAAPINNALNAELDAAFRARFVLFLAGLSKATKAAILAALLGVQQGLQINLLENTAPGGATVLGEFTAVIDDGSGTPPAALVTLCINAVQGVRGFTINAQVVAVTKIIPTIALNIRAGTGFILANVQAAVQAAVVAAVNAIQLGTPTLFVSAIEQAALAVPGCIGVQPGQTLINGTNADLAITGFQVPRITTAAVGSY
jgi:hypothetical protein